jgi:hypothetical protein
MSSAASWKPVYKRKLDDGNILLESNTYPIRFCLAGHFHDSEATAYAILVFFTILAKQTFPALLKISVSISLSTA